MTYCSFVPRMKKQTKSNIMQGWNSCAYCAGLIRFCFPAPSCSKIIKIAKIVLNYSKTVSKPRLLMPTWGAAGEKGRVDSWHDLRSLYFSKISQTPPPPLSFVFCLPVTRLPLVSKVRPTHRRRVKALVWNTIMGADSQSYSYARCVVKIACG